MLRKFFLDFIKIHILHHAEDEPIYGLWMATELARHGYEDLSPGTLYPALHRLEEDGYLVSERRLVKGRWRRYYAITPAGREVLTEIRSKLIELANEVLPTEHMSQDQRRCSNVR